MVSRASANADPPSKCIATKNSLDLVPLYDLPLWRSIVIIVETIALMLGGPIGSLLIDAVDWRLYVESIGVCNMCPITNDR